MSGTIKKAAIILALLVVVCAGISARGIMNGARPGVVSLDPPVPTANQEVVVTVTLDAPSSGQYVAIGCTDPLAFSDLPDSIYIPSGEESASFTTHTTSYYVGDAFITATAESVSAVKRLAANSLPASAR